MIKKIVGINYKTAPISIREQFYLSKTQVQQIYRKLSKQDVNFFILSTCSRQEIYLFDAESDLTEVWDFDDTMKKYTYTLKEKRAVEYFMRLILGLESFIEGEQEIRGQIKRSVDTAHDYGVLTKEITDWLISIINFVEELLMQYGLGMLQDEIYERYLRRLFWRFNIFYMNSLAVLGTGYIAEKILKVLRNDFFYENKIVIFSNKNWDRALELAKKFSVEYDKMENIYRRLGEFEAVLAATAAPHRILKYEKYLQVGGYRMFLDFSFPRDIDPKIKPVYHIEQFKFQVLTGREKQGLLRIYEELKRGIVHYA